jgi:hypothetical protein
MGHQHQQLSSSKTLSHTHTHYNKQQQTKFQYNNEKGEEKEKTFAHARTTKPTISHWQTYFSVFYSCFQLGAGHINDNKLNLQAAKIQPRFVGVGLFKAEMWVLRCCLDQIEI